MKNWQQKRPAILHRLLNAKIIFMDLRTTYMGLKLKSPIVVSASTLSEEVGNIVQMEDAGAGAVVLFSLFEEQLKKEEAKYEAVISNTSNMFSTSAYYSKCNRRNRWLHVSISNIRKPSWTLIPIKSYI